MAQQTSVEWLVKEINKLTGLTIAPDEPIIEQAKEMHKAEILTFVRTMPRKTGVTQEGQSYVQYDDEAHYNQTYNK